MQNIETVNLLFHILVLEIFFVIIINRGFLVLLVLGHQVVHVGLGLSELHLVHALPGVPMEESLPPEHSRELLRDSLENFLDGSCVAHEGGSHLETSGGMSQTLVMTLLGIHS